MAAAAALGIAGLAISVPGLIDICVRYVEFLKTRYESFQKAESQTERVRFRLELQLHNLDDALNFMKIVSPNLAPDVEQQLNGILQILAQDILPRAIERLPQPNPSLSQSIAGGKSPNIRQRLGFAFGRKSQILIIEAELEKWVDQFKTRMFFLALVPGNIVHPEATMPQTQTLNNRSHLSALKELISRGHGGEKPDMLLPVDQQPRQPLQLSYAHAQYDGKFTVVEFKKPPAATPNAPSSSGISEANAILEKRDVVELASILNASDPQLTSILQCQGYYKNEDQKNGPIAYALAFSSPPLLQNPRSLRDLLITDLDKDPRHPLNDRMRLARRIASSILFVHTAGLVHKNIHPEHILVFEELDAGVSERFPRRLGYPYLIGFEYARNMKVYSERIGDNLWWKDIYRHPQRQGLHPEKKYSMLHDVYSVGVVLLEIALWTPFVIDKSHIARSSPVTQITNAQVNPALRSTCNLTQASEDGYGRRLKTAFEIQEVFISTAKRELPRNMGQRYCDVVLQCLQCVEQTALEEDTDDTMLHSLNLDLGKSYIEGILDTLEEIQL